MCWNVYFYRGIGSIFFSRFVASHITPFPRCSRANGQDAGTEWKLAQKRKWGDVPVIPPPSRECVWGEVLSGSGPLSLTPGSADQRLRLRSRSSDKDGEDASYPGGSCGYRCWKRWRKAVHTLVKTRGVNPAVDKMMSWAQRQIFPASRLFSQQKNRSWEKKNWWLFSPWADTVGIDVSVCAFACVSESSGEVRVTIINYTEDFREKLP